MFVCRKIDNILEHTKEREEKMNTEIIRLQEEVRRLTNELDELNQRML